MRPCLPSLRCAQVARATWNPAKEDQATDRAYRIGQTKEVNVYCPVVFADDFTTFDVKLDQLLTSKRALAGDMLNGTGDVGPGEFAIEDVVPDSGDRAFSEGITLNDALRMEPPRPGEGGCPSPSIAAVS